MILVRGCGRDYEENSCGSAIRLGMVVPCSHYTYILRFLDSLVTAVRADAIRQAIRISMAAGSGTEASNPRLRFEISCPVADEIKGERQPLNDKNKTYPGNLGEGLDPMYQSVNP
ncbi:hypothetical protein CSKR_108069 [Clonorchis sinensis]|uniref:Uncharacterized protein n=1 Tax=Clonorchis sinensis TaxID=79923 RepID=A0A419PMU4_CLOSI|nr:hypothetical protein CSKR_108069 [Clonorchis sinensis]